MRNKKIDLFSIGITRTYGALLIIFGSIGYIKEKSLVSLLSGTFFGLLLIWCSSGMRKNHKSFTLTALVFTTFLIASFFFRAIASHKILPIVFGSLGLCLFLTLFYRLIKK